MFGSGSGGLLWVGVFTVAFSIVMLCSYPPWKINSIIFLLPLTHVLRKTSWWVIYYWSRLLSSLTCRQIEKSCVHATICLMDRVIQTLYKNMFMFLKCDHVNIIVVILIQIRSMLKAEQHWLVDVCYCWCQSALGSQWSPFTRECPLIWEKWCRDLRNHFNIFLTTFPSQSNNDNLYTAIYSLF